MNRSGLAAIAALVLAIAMISSAAAIPLLGANGGPSDVGGADDATGTEPASQHVSAVSMEPTTPDLGANALTRAQEDAVERGVDEGIELVQEQGVEVTQEQRTAAIEGAIESTSRHQAADVEQVQRATKGAVHGALVQEQRVNASQVQAVVGGATDGALAQYQRVNATQMQSATWGASHGAIAQRQTATVEQLQVASRGAAAGAAAEAGETDVRTVGKIQEAAQGAAYGVISQYQTVTVEQRQRITLDHVQHAAAGASAGALEGSTRVVIEQEQRIEVEQRQEVTIKQVQQAAKGAAKGALVQKQAVSVEQTQAAARGAGKGSLKQIQRISVTQIQRISITQIQEASFGAAKGAIHQSQEASVEQIQAAADGGASGVLAQRQEVRVSQTQSAAFGATKGAVASAIQYQIVQVEQVQAAARGAGYGAVTQTQVVTAVQVQRLAEGASSGTLSQAQEATAVQIQTAASSACRETAAVVQNQRVSVTQIQTITSETAAEVTAFAADEGIEDQDEISGVAGERAAASAEEVEELEGTATIDVDDQPADETVVVDAVDLSEGGFVAVYADAALEPDDVIGVSEFLEPGESEAVEVDLEEPLAEGDDVYVVAHLDTTGDESFDYVETDGEADVPYVTEGGTPVFDGAVVGVEDELEVVDVDEEFEDVEPIEEDEEPIEEDEEPIEEDEEPIEEDDEPEVVAEATLTVDDQTGDGETLEIEEANATVEYAVAAEYDGERVESETFEAAEPVENLTLELDPPLDFEDGEAATVAVSVIDAETGESLADEEIEYAVEAATADVTFEDQASNGTNVTVDAVDLSEGGFVAIHDERALEEPSPETVLGVSEFLEPGESEDVEVEFDLEEPIAEGEYDLVAVAHLDTTGDESFDYVETAGETDVPYVDDDGEPVTDEGRVSVVADVPAAFAVEIVGTNDPIEVGDDLEVEATVENVGDEGGEGEIVLEVGGSIVDVTEVTLDSEESEDVTLTFDTADVEPGEYPVVVSSEDDADETTVVLEEAGEPALFAVADLSAPESAESGETIEISATIENQGDLAGETTVTYLVDGSVVAQEALALEGGESAVITFAFPVPTGFEGETTHTIGTDDDEGLSAAVFVTDSPTEDDDAFDEEDEDDSLFDESVFEESGDVPTVG